MTKLVLTLALLIVPMLAMVSEAVTPRVITPPAQLAVRSDKGIITTSSTQGSAPLKVAFTAIVAPSQEISFDWNFGDGNVAQGRQVTHAFTIPGEYTTTLTLTDQQNITTEYMTTITVEDERTVSAGTSEQG